MTVKVTQTQIQIMTAKEGNDTGRRRGPNTAHPSMQGHQKGSPSNALMEQTKKLKE